MKRLIFASIVAVVAMIGVSKIPSHATEMRPGAIVTIVGVEENKVLYDYEENTYSYKAKGNVNLEIGEKVEGVIYAYHNGDIRFEPYN